MKKFCKIIALIYLIFWATSHFVSAEQNTLELESTFKGNQEQPKVLYIVPWQAVEAPPASYRPLQSLVQQNFQLLDREEFRRNVVFRSEALKKYKKVADIEKEK